MLVPAAIPDATLTPDVTRMILEFPRWRQRQGSFWRIKVDTLRVVSYTAEKQKGASNNEKRFTTSIAAGLEHY